MYNKLFQATVDEIRLSEAIPIVRLVNETVMNFITASETINEQVKKIQ